jgi:hypothetical protein
MGRKPLWWGLCVPAGHRVKRRSTSPARASTRRRRVWFESTRRGQPHPAAGGRHVASGNNGPRATMTAPSPTTAKRSDSIQRRPPSLSFGASSIAPRATTITPSPTTTKRSGSIQRRPPLPGFVAVPFDEWTSVFGSERLTGALLDRLTHHVHILEMKRRKLSSRPKQAPIQTLATRYAVRRDPAN